MAISKGRRSGSKELKGSKIPQHVGQREPYYRCQAKTTSVGAAQTLKTHTQTQYTHVTHPPDDFISLQNHNNVTLFYSLLSTLYLSKTCLFLHSPSCPDTHNLPASLSVAVSVLPGRGCWCTAAAGTRGVFPGWWPVGPSAAAPSG